MSIIDERSQAFGEVFLGVNLREEEAKYSPEQAMLKIRELQCQLAQAYQDMQSTATFDQHLLNPLNLIKRSFQRGVPLTKLRRSGDALQLSLMVPFRCFYKNGNRDVADGVIYRSLPLYEFQAHLKPSSYSWRNSTKEIPEASAAQLVRDSMTQLGENLYQVRNWGGTNLLPAMSLRDERFMALLDGIGDLYDCLGTQRARDFTKKALGYFHRNDSDSRHCGHPHSNNHTRSFSGGCTGTHFFANALSGGKVKNSAVLMNVLDDMAHWAGDFTVDDSYRGLCSPIFPLMVLPGGDTRSVYRDPEFYQHCFLGEHSDWCMKQASEINRKLFRLAQQLGLIELQGDGTFAPKTPPELLHEALRQDWVIFLSEMVDVLTSFLRDMAGKLFAHLQGCFTPEIPEGYDRDADPDHLLDFSQGLIHPRRMLPWGAMALFNTLYNFRWEMNCLVGTLRDTLGSLSLEELGTSTKNTLVNLYHSLAVTHQALFSTKLLYVTKHYDDLDGRREMFCKKTFITLLVEDLLALSRTEVTTEVFHLEGCLSTVFRGAGALLGDIRSDPQIQNLYMERHPGSSFWNDFVLDLLEKSTRIQMQEYLLAEQNFARQSLGLHRLEHLEHYSENLNQGKRKILEYFRLVSPSQGANQNTTQNTTQDITI